MSLFWTDKRAPPNNMAFVVHATMETFTAWCQL